MADEAKTAAPGLPGEGLPQAPSKLPLVLALVNTLAVAGAVGALAYTRLMFKRPAITESGERRKIEAKLEKPAAPTKVAFVTFDTFTVNIKATPDRPAAGEGAQQVKGKLHYVTLGYALEIRDEDRAYQITNNKAKIMDKVLHLLGTKAFHELNSVQGRYVLRSEILDLANAIVTETGQGNEEKKLLVTNVLLNNFTVQ